MADTTDATAPAGYDLYAGYIDGNYRSFAPLNRQYPGKVVSITVLGNTTAQVADVEAGDLTPDTAPGWVRRCGANRYMAWVADYGVAHCPLAGAVAWQKIDHGPNGENIDVSEVYDDGWPYAGVPTLYFPWSWAGEVMQKCSQAGLTLVRAGDIQPTPTTGDDDVLFIEADGHAGDYLIVGGLVLAIDDPPSANAFLAAGAKRCKVSEAEYQRIAGLAR